MHQDTIGPKRTPTVLWLIRKYRDSFLRLPMAGLDETDTCFASFFDLFQGKMNSIDNNNYYDYSVKRYITRSLYHP